jgi:hypothetical protein
MIISIFVIAYSAFNFSNLKGSECIRAIHIVTLLVCGMGIAVFLSSLFAFIVKKKREANQD